MEEKKTMDEKGGYVITASQQQSSMELSKNGKGDFAYVLKCYNDSPEKAEAILRDMKARVEAIIKGA